MSNWLNVGLNDACVSLCMLKIVRAYALRTHSVTLLDKVRVWFELLKVCVCVADFGRTDVEPVAIHRKCVFLKWY